MIPLGFEPATSPWEGNNVNLCIGRNLMHLIANNRNQKNVTLVRGGIGLWELPGSRMGTLIKKKKIQ